LPDEEAYIKGVAPSPLSKSIPPSAQDDDDVHTVADAGEPERIIGVSASLPAHPAADRAGALRSLATKPQPG